MPCELTVDRNIKPKILDCDDKTKQEVGDFLLDLQEFPLPKGRHELMSLGSYYYQLPSGHFISWELIGNRSDLTRMIFNRDMRGISVRVLGFGQEDPVRGR